MKPRPFLFIAAAILAAPAYAQTAQPAAPAVSGAMLVEVERGDLIVPDLNVSIDELKSMRIFGAEGEEIGEIEDVLATASGEVSAVTLEVGGFLGAGEREVIVGLDQIRVEGLRLTLGATREQVEALPVWDD